MVLAFIFLSFSGKLGRLLPPLIGALIVGAVAIVLTGSFDSKNQEMLTIAPPTLYLPAFSWQAMVELVVPLAITVLVVQNGQGFAVLSAAGHKPPINAIAAACGAGSMLTAFVGSVSTCLTGPVNAILSSAGEKHRHYTGGVVVGILALGFGLMSPFFTRLLLATPPAFIAALGGLAMLRVLQTAFSVSFGGGKFTLGALVTFLVTVADVPIFNVGAAFWGLVFGFGISWLLERGDFRR
jgi:benzoate membrane transport protein